MCLFMRLICFLHNFSFYFTSKLFIHYVQLFIFIFLNKHEGMLQCLQEAHQDQSICGSCRFGGPPPSSLSHLLRIAGVSIFQKINWSKIEFQNVDKKLRLKKCKCQLNYIFKIKTASVCRKNLQNKKKGPPKLSLALPLVFTAIIRRVSSNNRLQIIG